MNEKRGKQIQAGLLIATIVVWCVFGYMFLEGTWKEDLERINKEIDATNQQYAEIDWGNTTMPYFNDSVVDGTNESTTQNVRGSS